MAPPTHPQTEDPMSRSLRRPAEPLALALAALALWAAAPSSAWAQERHAEYYYPTPTVERYVSRAQTAPNANREVRIQFINSLTAEQMSRPYSPEYAIFVKGSEAEKMIIVALNDGAISNLYQARALLAQLTAIARNSALFEELGVEDLFTFFDLAKLLGFRRITISDGQNYAHQVLLG